MLSAGVHPAGTGAVHISSPAPCQTWGGDSPAGSGDRIPIPRKDGDNCWCSRCRWNCKRCVIAVDDIDLPKAAMRPWMPAISVVGGSTGFIFAPDQKTPLAVLTGSGWNQSIHVPCSKQPFVLPAQSGKSNAPSHHLESHGMVASKHWKLSRPCLYPDLPNGNVGIANSATCYLCRSPEGTSWLLGCATAVRIYPNKRAIYTEVGTHVPTVPRPGGGGGQA